MTDKKVNLQDLFDEQSQQYHSKYYITSKEGRERITESNKTRYLNEETRAKMRENHVGYIGKRHSEETRAKMSKVRIGKTHTEEHKLKQSEGAIRRWEENPYVPTEEVGKKRSESLKKYWAEKKASMPPKVVKPKQPKKRGRPKTRPERDPNAPPKKRGRPPKVSGH